jgi:hypothetical protein
MPKNSYYPDEAEPHLHIHKNGVTFTGVGHNHRNLQRGDVIYYGTINALIVELEEAGDDRSLQMVQYIRDNITD